MSARIRFRPHITKKMYFFLPSARIRLFPISEEKQSISGDKTNIFVKKYFITRDKKYFSSYVFFAFFFVALIAFFIRLIFFNLVAVINFSRNIFNVFFIFSPSLTFPKIGAMFFFLNFFFTLPHYILDFLWFKTEKVNIVALVLRCATPSASFSNISWPGSHGNRTNNYISETLSWAIKRLIKQPTFKQLLSLALSRNIKHQGQEQKWD